MTHTGTTPVPAGQAPRRGFLVFLESLGLSTLGGLGLTEHAAQALLSSRGAASSPDEMRARAHREATEAAARARAERAAPERLGPEIEWIP